MPLKLISGFMTSSGGEALLMMDSGVGNRIVVISLGALAAIEDPPRADEFRLQKYIETFSDIASDKYDHKQFDPSGRIKITSQDVRRRSDKAGPGPISRDAIQPGFPRN